MAFDNLNVFVILSATSMEFVVVRLIAVFSIPLQTPLSGVMGGRRWDLWNAVCGVILSDFSRNESPLLYYTAINITVWIRAV